MPWTSSVGAAIRAASPLTSSAAGRRLRSSWAAANRLRENPARPNAFFSAAEIRRTPS
jgi:hypothetical protein